MNFLDRIKKNLFLRQFQKANAFVESTYEVDPSVTSIGILFDGTITENRMAVEALVQELRNNGHEVYPLGYIDNDAVASGYAFKHYYRKNINWYYIPKHSDIDVFLNKNYSVLINLGDEDSLHLHYIAKKTKADFKIGPAHEEMQLYDLMVRPKESKNTQELIESIKNVLKSVEYKK